MTDTPPATSAESLLIERLVANGTDTVFGLPGGGPNLKMVGAAMSAGLRFVLAHAETSAAIMASTYGRLTGNPSAVIVTRGPGAASVVNGAAQATLDRAPLVVITDTVAEADRDRCAHQRIDQRALLAPVTKAGITLNPTTTATEVDELIATAMCAPFGAVHVDTDATAVESDLVVRGTDSTSVAKRIDDVDAALALLATASSPVVIVGDGATSEPTVCGLLEASGLPVLTTYQAIGMVDTEGDQHAGLFTNGAIERSMLARADLIVAVGLDITEPIPASWAYGAPVLSITATPTVDPYLPIEIELIGDIAATLRDLHVDHLPRSTWAADAGRVGRTHARVQLRRTRADAFGPLELVDALIAGRPDDVTVTVDAGAHFLAIMPMWPVDRPHGLLISNGLATMGFAVPAAIGAALARPGAPVLALTGDGGLAMTLGELETIARLELPVTVVCFNDAELSLIKIKQRDGQGGDDAVRFRAVDHAAQARAAGLAASTVTTAAELDAAVADASDWQRPRLIDARIDPSDYLHLIEVTRG